MLNRREFLTGLTALAGSYILTACGGSSEGADALSGIDKSTTATPSPDGATIPSGTSLVDKSGNVWTVSNGVIYRNGATVGNTYNVSLLLWYGARMYHCGTGGQFYVWTNLMWLPCGDPRQAVAATAGQFFGMNGHYDYTYTPAQLITMLQALGVNMYRVACTDNPTSLNAVAKIAQAFQGTGITLFVCLNQGLTDTTGALFANESVAYNRGRTVGSTVAGTLKQYGVTMYECGNELTRQQQTVLNFTYAGTKAVDFNNTNWPVMRGMMRGMIDGVKSAQSNAKCGINFCVADIGASDALWDGMQPDGSGGYPKVRWDITTWHNYEAYGDIFNIGMDGAGPGFDLPTYCKARYGVPFMITEWNASPQQTDQYRATYVSQRLAAFYAARKTKNVQSVMYYVLDSGDHTYGIVKNGVAIDPTYTAFKTFTAANPDT
jgi:hypothetical protein